MSVNIAPLTLFNGAILHHYIYIYIVPLKKFSDAILSEIQRMFTEFQRPLLIQI